MYKLKGYQLVINAGGVAVYIKYDILGVECKELRSRAANLLKT